MLTDLSLKLLVVDDDAVDWMTVLRAFKGADFNHSTTVTIASCSATIFNQMTDDVIFNN